MNNANKYFRYFIYIRPLIRLPIIRTYGTTIFSIFMMTVFIFFAIKPTAEVILVLQKKLEDLNLIHEKLQKKAKDLSLGKRNYENLDPAIKGRIHTAILDSIGINSLAKSLEGAAQAHNASISALQVQPQILEVRDDNQIGKLSEASFTFNVEGSFQNIISILQDLSISSRLISIEGLSITKIIEGSGVVMSISGKAWYLK